MPSRRNESDERQEMILWFSSLNQPLPSSLDKPTKPAREVTKKPTSKPLDADSKPEFGARLVKMANTVNAGIAPAKPPHDFDTPFGLEAGPSEGTGKGKDPVTKKTTARPTPAVESKGETVAASAILAMASRPEMAKAQKYATEALAKPDGPQTTNEQMTEFLENFRVATMAYLSVDEMSEEEGTRDQDRTLMRQALGTTKELREGVQRLTALVGGLRPSPSGLNLGTAVPLHHANASAGAQMVGAPILPTNFTSHPTSHVFRQPQEKTTRDDSSSSSEADDLEYDRIRKPDDPMYQKYYLQGGTRRYHDEKKKRIDTPSTAFLITDTNISAVRTKNSVIAGKGPPRSGPVTVHRGATERNPVVIVIGGIHPPIPIRRHLNHPTAIVLNTGKGTITIDAPDRTNGIHPPAEIIKPPSRTK
ncbi:hypothetical protein DFH27DRAFT_528013 [Peziza echinospora]|nr:hypothetical protein DFH27DRAFT_528013 [Peziza echinospora]